VRGIRQAVELLTAKLDSLHNAHHQTMDVLGQIIWESQRGGRPLQKKIFATMHK
jgi:hypothetical protein